MTTQDESKVGAARSTALDELKDVRRSLQDAGITLLQAATAAISAAAKDTLSATKAVVAAAEDTLDAAERKLRAVREQLRSHA